jgi:hypothetical protein
MIVVKLEGGLANRMFQYAFYLAIKEIRNDVFIDENSFKPAWSFENISIKKTFPNVQFKDAEMKHFYAESKNSKLVKLLRNILEKYSDKYFHEEETKYYPTLINNLPKNCYLRGYWQTEKYFYGIKDKIIKAFSFNTFTENENIITAKQMSEENSISIHVRKGKDYFCNGGITYGTCTLEYYKEAIKYINEHIPNPIFYVFTDNPQWVKDKFQFINYKLVDWNPVSGEKNYRDMQLMTYCKHNIIANSSYSWWGAWLNQTPDKIVIGPKVWFNKEIKQGKDIIPHKWIVI